ncbi:MAG TPA: heme lyase CcmF/NrfE family subunit [Anaerolineales bacterium]|nr:heme lyase CcmF/NrfE family subunit [Anaerolineales bacterium]
MVADFGYGVIVIAFMAALYSAGAAIYGERTKSANWVESARRAMLLLWPLISLSALSLIYLLITNHFEVSFVYEVTSREMPTYLKVTAWWGGQAGSLVFWSWLMTAFASLVTLRKWDRDHEFLPWVIVVTSITTAFFLGLVVFYENPFAFFWSGPDGKLISDAAGNALKSMFAPIAGASIYFPADGNGLNPLLRHPGMIIHPPMLYLGFVSFVIPFAFAMAALITGRTDDRWIRITRRWTLWAWLFLSCGLVLGSRWAYDVLGWGGFWGWDPVEIAALMPWLTGTAFLHSVMIQEKRGLLKQWNMLLIILTYSLVIFGTFLTRSGVLSSVHAFAQSAIGPAFFTFIGITFVVSIALLIYRWPDLRSETEMKSMLSREALFLLNNLLFISVLVVCFWGVVFPLVSQLFTGQTVTVGPPFYQAATTPLFATLILLMGIAPLSSWGHSSIRNLGRALWKSVIGAAAVAVILFFTYTNNPIALAGFFLIALVLFVTLQEFWRGTHARMKAQNENAFTAFYRLVGRDRRRYGGYVIHISMMLMAIGILGINLFQVQTQGTVPVNNSLSLSGYTVKYDSIAQFPGPDGRQVTRAVVSVYQGKAYLGDLYPRIDYYPTEQQNMTIPGQRSTLKDDLYIILVDWQPAAANGATFKIFVNPLVNWLWIGAIVFLFGILVAAWPERDAERMPARVHHVHQAEGKQSSAAD